VYLGKRIDHLTIPVNCSPPVLLLTPNLHEDFVNEKGVAETLIPTLQPLGILRAKLVTP
jgi:hypothetical protein